MEKKYVRKTNNGYEFLADPTFASHILIKLDDFERLKSYSRFELPETDAPSFYTLTKEEYNGYQNAMRIIRDRSLQDIDKSKADENGYQLLTAKKIKDPERKSKYEFVSITKNTPYSINMPLETVAILIEKDLCDYYHFIQEEDLFIPNKKNDEYAKFKVDSYMSESEELDTDPLFFEKKLKYDQYNPYYNYSKYLHEKYGPALAFKIESINAQYGLGVYQVTYYATDFV